MNRVTRGLENVNAFDHISRDFKPNVSLDRFYSQKQHTITNKQNKNRTQTLHKDPLVFPITLRSHLLYFLISSSLYPISATEKNFTTMAVSVSVWASSILASWFSPSSLFILLNLTIGTIFLMTRFGTRKAPEHHRDYSHQLARAPSSLLDRVKSINFSLYTFEPPRAAQTELHHHQEPDHLTEHPNQIVRTPSLIERLKSIQLYRSEREMVHPDPSREVYGQGHVAEYPNHPDNSTPLVRTPSLLERLKSIKLYRSEPEIIHRDPSPEVHDGGHPDNSSQLVRNPSLLERLKSIKLYKSEQPDRNPETETMSLEFHEHGVKRSKSESERKAKRREEKMTKSASEKSTAAAKEDKEEGGEEEIAVLERRRPATTRVEKSSRGVDQTVSSWEDDGVDAKADDFINRFKQQLKLQRLESLKRFRETWKGK